MLRLLLFVIGMAVGGRSIASANQEMTVELPGGGTMDFVWVPPGSFMMGSPATEANRDSTEGPQRRVAISRGFWMGKYELTQGQWEAVMEEDRWQGEDPHVVDDPSQPAVGISYDDLGLFVTKLNLAQDAKRYRIPTEAEWEYACRAGTTTPWSFGSDGGQLSSYAWYWTDKSQMNGVYTHAVGGKQPNPWGLYDMHGNVNEWTQDWLDKYPREAQTDPVGPTMSSRGLRVVRGGNVVALLWEGGGTVCVKDFGTTRVLHLV